MISRFAAPPYPASPDFPPSGGQNKPLYPFLKNHMDAGSVVFAAEGSIYNSHLNQPALRAEPEPPGAKPDGGLNPGAVRCLPPLVFGNTVHLISPRVQKCSPLSAVSGKPTTILSHHLTSPPRNPSRREGNTFLGQDNKKSGSCCKAVCRNLNPRFISLIPSPAGPEWLRWRRCGRRRHSGSLPFPFCCGCRRRL